MRGLDPPDEADDAQLVTRTAEGDRDAFAALFERHHHSVYRFCVQMTGSRDAAEDLTQEVFMALARSAAGYDPGRGSLPTYLYGIARRLVVRWGRGRRP